MISHSLSIGLHFFSTVNLIPAVRPNISAFLYNSENVIISGTDAKDLSIKQRKKTQLFVQNIISGKIHTQ